MSAAPLPSSPVGKDDIDTILTSFDTTYAWNYGSVKEGLRDLYEKAKREQWNGTDAARLEHAGRSGGRDHSADLQPARRLRPVQEARRQAGHANSATPTISLQLSQFMHGEQGALIVASQLTGAVPWMDAKYYAATQTMDEARHVEVFSRYLRDKLEWEWPINPNLKQLLDMIIRDSRWDLKYLGMQILVEGLAMAAFANMYQMAVEPLVQGSRALRHEGRVAPRRLRRHLAEGLLRRHAGARDAASARTSSSRPAELMRDRLIGEEIAATSAGTPTRCARSSSTSPVMKMFRQSLFARVVPNIKKLGLLTPRVRKGFEQLEIIQFEDFDPEAADRAMGLS